MSFRTEDDELQFELSKNIKFSWMRYFLPTQLFWELLPQKENRGDRQEKLLVADKALDSKVIQPPLALLMCQTS